MNQKIKLTKLILEILGLNADDHSIKKIIPVWWHSVRRKEAGGLRLTQDGFNAFEKAGIKSYKVRYADPVHFTNQLIVRIDNFIDCPFYLHYEHIYVFSEKMAVQLALFSGNIYKYSTAKARHRAH